MAKQAWLRCACGLASCVLEMNAGAPLQADDIAVELAAHVVKVGEDEGLGRVKAAGDDVLYVLAPQAVRLLQLQAPVQVQVGVCMERLVLIIMAASAARTSTASFRHP
jgi:hypothetical protein